LAVCIIKKNDLKEKDILIFSSGYIPPRKMPYVQKAFSSLPQSKIKKILRWNVPVEHDAYINSFLGENENFLAYVDLMHMHQRILITHKKCVGFSFMEEGTASYAMPNVLEDIGHIYRKKSNRYHSLRHAFLDMRLFLRGYNSKLISMEYAPQSYANVAKNFYCLSKFAYPQVDFAKKNIINFKEVSLENFFPQRTKPLKNDLIWIEESFTYAYKIPEIEYQKAILKTIQTLSGKLNGRPVYLKKRPNQKTKDSLVYKILSENGYEVFVLDNDEVLEVLLMNSSSCILIGNISSLLFYGSLFGHTSYSMFDVIPHKPKTVFEDLDFYWDSVIKI
jgi:hypothetical protein